MKEFINKILDENEYTQEIYNNGEMYANVIIQALRESGVKSAEEAKNLTKEVLAILRGYFEEGFKDTMNLLSEEEFNCEN